ncbi:MAG: TatD family hydrolase [Firmicutes bacterium]|nr:TatD family hydrolase [Bacillota bacterium]
MYIDTHAHLDDEQFRHEPVEELLKRAGEKNVRYIIAPAVGTESAAKLMEIAEQFPNVYFAAGIHAHDALSFFEKEYVTLKKMLAHPKAVAVGEVGLDYFYNFSPRSMQIHVLRRFVRLSLITGKPLILHCRDAEQDLYDILKEENGKLTGVIHCFSGNEEWAKRFLDLGFYLGFTGAVTFKNSEHTRNVVATVPSDRILTETDAPYMTPAPFRKIKPNEPAFIPVIADKIAEVKGIDSVEAAGIFVENAEKCFNIKLS